MEIYWIYRNLPLKEYKMKSLFSFHWHLEGEKGFDTLIKAFAEV